MPPGKKTNAETEVPTLHPPKWMIVTWEIQQTSPRSFLAMFSEEIDETNEDTKRSLYPELSYWLVHRHVQFASVYKQISMSGGICYIPYIGQLTVGHFVAAQLRPTQPSFTVQVTHHLSAPFAY